MSRLLVQAFGAWTNCLETDKELAEAGVKLAEMAGMAKKAKLSHFNPVTHYYRPNIADCVIAREFYHTIESVERVLRASTLLLKDKGQLLMTDFMLTEDAARQDATPWQEHLPYNANLWRSNKFEKTLANLNMDVRVNEDVSDRYCELIVQAWRALNSAPRLAEFDADTCNLILKEVERWAACVRAIEKGVIQVRRIHSIKKSAFDPNELRGSDWT